MDVPNYNSLRRQMVESQLLLRGIASPSVLEAMTTVERHRFVPDNLKELAYHDSPLPIGFSQTISQPYIVAYMTELLMLQKFETVLEIGTGSGYQSAVLAQICKHVYSIERNRQLWEQSSQLFDEFGYGNITTHYGDGYEGLQQYAPFDAILVTCALKSLSPHWLSQLADGGRLIAPLGESNLQNLCLLKKDKGKIVSKKDIPVVFVPMLDKRGNQY